MEDYKGLSREQVGAIRQSIKLGRTLQEDHPEIAVIYGYYSQRDIPEMLDIQSRYSVSDSVALNGVHRAIVGHKEGFGIEGYVGLITDEEEREWIGREHMIQNGQKGGLETHKQGIGVHGRTAKQMSEDALKSTIARGRTPWTDEEKEFAYMLSQKQEYQHPNGSKNPGKSNNELIAIALNIKYHDCNEVRSTKAVELKLFKHRKSLADIVV